MHNTTNSDQKVRGLIDKILTAQSPRAGSLLITVFGDTISQHGNSVWLGSLLNALANLNLNARQIRTAVFRLVRDGWLKARPSGRKSDYALTEYGLAQYAHAATRIYSLDQKPWDGLWTLVMPTATTSNTRTELRRRLQWQGYGRLSTSVYAHPQGELDVLETQLVELDCVQDVLVWRASAASDATAFGLTRQAGKCWHLETLAQRYLNFIALFDVEWPGTITAHDAFLLRTLLVHAYRRILLNAADLPCELLPKPWPGHHAASLAASLYRFLSAPALAFICARMENCTGPLPAPQASYYQRFGGIKRAPPDALRHNTPERQAS